MSFIEWIRVVFYGIVEGITEWLPVSSTGHLILFESFWPMQVSDDFLRMFRVVIQLGAILAVCVLYFDRLNPFSKKHSGSQKQEIWQIWVKVIIGCIPAGVLGILLDDFLDAHFYKWQVVAATLILYGIAFILLEIRNRSVRPKIRSFRQMSYGTAFFMAIPVMFGASFLKLVKYGLSFTAPEILCLLTGMVVAFVVSLIVIRFLMDFIKRYSFQIFGYYRIILGILVIIVALVSPGLLP